MPADRNLDHLFPAFRRRIEAAMLNMQAWLDVHRPNHEWRLIEGFRTAKYQQELFAKGRTAPGKIVTYRDGVKTRSNHQSSLAADCVPFHLGKPVWALDAELWEYWGHCVREQGLDSGGDWHIPDYPHAEWPETNKVVYHAARAWQKLRGIK